MKKPLLLAAAVLLLALSYVSAQTFVFAASLNPTPPYSSWATAAKTIQEGVDAAAPGSVVLVSNGVYAGGIVIGKPLLVLAVGRAQFTSIDGGGTNRCVWLTNGVRLDSFTLLNGSADNGGAVWCSSSDAYVTNCVIVRNSATGAGGGVWGGTIGTCTISNNTAGSGGGAASATLEACVVTGNSASASGGGTFQCALNNCLLTGNNANAGGGASGGTLNNCTLVGNQANSGGGAQAAALNNSIAYLNNAPDGSNANSCALNYCCTTPLPGAGIGNIDLNPQFVSLAGGNLRLQSASPCINAGNNALVVYPTGLDLDHHLRIDGGRVDMGAYEFQGAASAVVVTQPQSQSVYSGSNVTFTAAAAGTSPLYWQWYFNGTPLAAGTASSLTLMAVATNQAGNYFVVVSNSWGSDSSHMALLTVTDAAPTITRQPLSQTVPAGNSVTLTADAVGSLPLSWQWRFNGAPISGATTASLAIGPMTGALAGNYSVVVTNIYGSATSDDAGITLGVGAISYVWQNSPNPTPPYGDWGTAAHTIQDAANAAGAGYQIVVTNGTYAGGLTISRSLALVSVNGPGVTVVDGGGELVPCVSLTNGASLSGFTVTHGYGYDGGGAWCTSTNVFLTNCVLVDNRAQQSGGGVYGGTLYHCTLTRNSATNFSSGAYGSALVDCTISTNLVGAANSCVLYNCRINGNGLYAGGVVFCTLYNCTLLNNGSTYYPFYAEAASWSTLYNCTLSGNRMGAWNSTLYNCIIYYSTDSGGTNYAGCTLNYCCTTPMPTNGVGNITNAPLFVDPAAADFHLQSDSPCINAGNNTWAFGSIDLDGNPRVVGGSVDIGAYEFQAPGSTISYAWLQKCGLPTDGSADYTDLDGDGLTQWQEWVCGTDPANALSALRLLSAAPAGNGITVTWQSVAGISYFLERGTNVTSWFALGPTNGMNTNIVVVATNIAGMSGTTSFTDTNAAGSGPFFYRVGVRPP